MTDPKPKWKWKWQWIAAGAVALALAAVWHFLPLQDWLRALDRWIDGLGFLGPAFYAAVYAAGSLLFVPGSVLGLVAGYLFGIAGGLAVSWIGATVAAAAAFLIGRYLARGSVERLARRNRRFGALDEAIGKKGWKVVGLLRLSAIVPFSLSNYLFGLTSIDFVPYVVASTVALVPGAFFYVYFGALGKSLWENETRSPWEWAILGAGLVATAVTAVFLTRLANKHLKSRRRS